MKKDASNIDQSSVNHITGSKETRDVFQVRGMVEATESCSHSLRHPGR
jgi:hypothetical protein